ncbi:MAG TPA: sulfurtransferase [Rhodopila sp.]|uniref:sulfurtransferase n=1 Tax=Rhodopila sp. TaxID=2480087 RepID=UPI002CF16CB0|nr:sulfurtransferase [Rhodopila sp.]HVY16695.1 sulfurtransferase [Rhodopila sp.]
MSGFVHPEFLVETGWLADHLADTVVLDCTVHLIPDPQKTYIIKPARDDFERGHIPGAQFCDVQKDVSDTRAKFNFMRQAPEDFAAAMRRFGISNDTKIVTYSTANVWWATRVWWLLREFGHDNAAVLNGGWQKWQAENRPVETGPDKRRSAGSFMSGTPRGLFVGKQEVAAAVGDPGVCTLNALTAAQHAGSGGNSYGRPGHIAGSLNVPAASLVDPATNVFLPPDELRARLGAADALNRSVIAYCGGGIAASADAMILTMLGHADVRVYDASLSEWAKDESLPMEVG